MIKTKKLLTNDSIVSTIPGYGIDRGGRLYFLEYHYFVVYKTRAYV